MSTESPRMASAASGGGFLIEDCSLQELFAPEDFSDQQRMIAETTDEFVRNEVLPRIDELEHQEPGLTPKLLRKAGELGLLSIDIPERYGGMELDMVSSLVAAEHIAQYASFAVAHGAHTGIGTLPILYFGTEEQKQKYLPRLASGEMLAAYCLSEAAAGSDALAARTRAALSPDGKHYTLNGEKMWITNAGFADLFIVFAKVDGEKFTCFLAERNAPGLSTGAEEKKMGIKGSSTRALILDNVAVPVENVLGEIGRGHIIAFNILNVGRLKLAAACVGGAKRALKSAAAYATERRAFGKAIGEFGLIQEKIAEMAARTFAGESIVYRTAGLIDARAKAQDRVLVYKAVEEYAVECSINKVFCSEVLDYVTDECVQIYGGYGYHQDYPAERAYRDSRINRIFEGTNEINRLVITGMLLKRATSGQLALMQAVSRVMSGALARPTETHSGKGILAQEAALVEAAKKTALFVAGAAYQKYTAELANEEEILAAIADLVIHVFAMESAVLRAEKLAALFPSQQERIARASAMARLFVFTGMDKMEDRARTALASIATGDMLRTQLAVLRGFMRRDAIDVIRLRRQIAEVVIRQGRYVV